MIDYYTYDFKNQVPIRTQKQIFVIYEIHLSKCIISIAIPNLYQQFDILFIYFKVYYFLVNLKL